MILMGDRDYVDKMSFSLNATCKFLQLGPVEKCDATTSIEIIFQKQLLRQVKSRVLSPEISEKTNLLTQSDPVFITFQKYISTGYLYDPYSL